MLTNTENMGCPKDSLLGLHRHYQASGGTLGRRDGSKINNGTYTWESCPIRFSLSGMLFAMDDPFKTSHDLFSRLDFWGFRLGLFHSQDFPAIGLYKVATGILGKEVKPEGRCISSRVTTGDRGIILTSNF